MARLTFDRGTLLLAGFDPPSPDPASGTVPPHVVWDARVGRYRAPAYRYREVARWLKRATGVTLEVFAQRARTELWSPPELRDYQHAALLSWAAAGRTGLVVLPTGAGKTRLACAAMASARCTALVLVPTRVLLHQWREEIGRHYRGQVGCLGDGEQCIEHVTVATFEGAYRHMQKLGNRFGLLVIDEAHHFGAGVRDEALEMCAAPLRLGLTATAPNEDGLARLADLLGPVVCKLAIADLAGAWLAEFDTVVLELPLNAEERRLYALALARFEGSSTRFAA